MSGVYKMLQLRYFRYKYLYLYNILNFVGEEQHKTMSEDTILSYKGVRICREEHIVFSDFAMELRAGEFVYLTGAVGAGKSTLLKTIYGEAKIDEGLCTVLGYDLRTLSTAKRQELRRKLGIVFQDFQLLPKYTAFENLDIVLLAWGYRHKKERKEQIEVVLEQVGLKNKGYKYPSELSGGEQQCLAIARAILGESKLILADEPTANLDPETGLQIVQLLHTLAQEHKAAVLMATHNLALLEALPARSIVL